jgi:hypothetical protein
MIRTAFRAAARRLRTARSAAASTSRHGAAAISAPTGGRPRPAGTTIAGGTLRRTSPAPVRRLADALEGAGRTRRTASATAERPRRPAGVSRPGGVADAAVAERACGRCARTRVLPGTAGSRAGTVTRCPARRMVPAGETIGAGAGAGAGTGGGGGTAGGAGSPTGAGCGTGTGSGSGPGAGEGGGGPSAGRNASGSR